MDLFLVKKIKLSIINNLLLLFFKCFDNPVFKWNYIKNTISTTKTSLEIEAPAGGRLAKINSREGELVEIGAVLGQSQLCRLDNMIIKRNENYRSYYELLLHHQDKFYIPTWNLRMSSFCFPLISKNIENYLKLEELLGEYKVEYRPVVGGNLLKQPFLNGYEANCPNADILHERGLYIGNSHFVGDEHMNLLEEILDQLWLCLIFHPEYKQSSSTS